MQGGTAELPPLLRINIARQGRFFIINERRIVMKTAFSILAHNQPDTLLRLTSLLYRRGYLIEKLSAKPSGEKNVVALNLIIDDSIKTTHLPQQLAKLVNILSVEIVPLIDTAPKTHLDSQTYSNAVLTQ